MNYFYSTPCRRGCEACQKFRSRQNAKSWYVRNTEYAKQRHREKYAEARAALAPSYLRYLAIARETNKKWRLENLEMSRQIIARWNAANIEKRRAYQRNRKARKHSNGGTHTAADIAAIFKAQNGRCALCKSDLKHEYHADHIVPITKGGSNDRRNIQLLCPPCNMRKSARDPLIHARSLGFLL